MEVRKKVFLFILLMIVIFLPQSAFAGEYDGIWTATEKVYVEDALIGTIENLDTIIYQQDENNLYTHDASLGIIYLVKSGDNWILYSSIDTVYEGETVTLDSMELTFTSPTSLTGSFSFSIETDGSLVNANVTITASKRIITSLSKGIPITNLEGNISSNSFFQIDIPPGSTDLHVSTSGGTGDCDLLITYYRPNFDPYGSSLDGNNEAIYLPSPKSGRWYVSLYGRDNYSGVTLLADYEEVPTADFTASPVKGRTPFDVSFSDQSTGDVTSWLWDFGDGGTSTEQNPIYTYGSPGTYTVSLTVNGPAGSDTEEKKDFITGRLANGNPGINLLLLDE